MHNVMLKENGSLEFVLSKQWLEFLLGGNRAFNFMLILGISSKCDLKTPSECLKFHVHVCECVCVHVCECVCVCACVCVCVCVCVCEIAVENRWPEPPAVLV